MGTAIDREAHKLAGHDNFAVVEPNHLQAPRSGGVYAQLPAEESIEVLEQGTFVKYDYANGEVNFTGNGPWMMVFNEEKLYDSQKQMHCDYAMKKADAYNGVIVPRVFRLYKGDIFTTNNLKAATYEVGDKVAPGADGILAAIEDKDIVAGNLVLEVAAETTMPDGVQPGLKLRVIAE